MPAETARQAIAALLRKSAMTAREISAEAHVSERDVAAHLDHLARSLAAAGERLIVEPAACAKCGFAFEGRDRKRRPSRCPACKSERIHPPRFRVERQAS